MHSVCNKDVARRFIHELWHRGNLNIINELCARNFIAQVPVLGDVNGRDAMRRFARIFREAFPDLELQLRDITADDDKVCLRWEFEATHREPLFDIPPTGRRVYVSGCSVLRIHRGKIEEDYTFWDALGLFRQLEPLHSNNHEVLETYLS